MSIEVALEDLAEEVERRGAGYLLTSADGGRPHVMRVRFAIVGTELRTPTGRSAAANIAAVPAVTLLWPPIGGVDTGEPPDAYSLIVDGEATVAEDPDGSVAVITATHAVLHRPAP